MRKPRRGFLMKKTRAYSAWISLGTSLVCIASLCLAGLAVEDVRADATYVYAVQISAQVQPTPAQITLNWEPDAYGATNYVIFRKAKDDTQWGQPVAVLSGNSSSYTDTMVSQGSAYEYRITKAGILGYTGYGYIYSGIEVPAIENRGTVVLVVASESTVGLETELAQLQSDLIGDGWQVIRHDVSTNDTPQNVRALIVGDYNADPGKVNTVFLLGHVPILQSGYINYDGHGSRPMPADAYYGEMNNDWPTDPATSPSYLPSDVALRVGRVDLANMPGNGAAVPWPSEVELLRNYLNKDHNWRQGQVAVPRRALMGNRRGDEGGLAVAASGYRNFEPLVGPGNTLEADVDDVAPFTQRWAPELAAGPYLWAYGCGSGQDTAIGYLGANGPDSEAWSTDLVHWGARSVFVMVFGSHLGNWDHTDNIMRAFLATPLVALTCCMSGEPHWFCHHMGLGEPIGYSTRLTMNNSTLYQSQMNPFTRAVYIALMGDPTLRMEPIPPPPHLGAVADAAGVHLAWTNPGNAAAGYSIYRAASPAGPFARLNHSLTSGTNFTDVTASPNTYTYMVRAVVLQTNFSGTYFNPSEGIFTPVTVPAPTGPVAVQAGATRGQVVLAWKSQAGVQYHVEARDALANDEWIGISGPIAATGPNSSWSGPITNSVPIRFYRVVSP
jgi:hypothetical protein